MARPFRMILPEPFQSALSECALLLSKTFDPWWIIGSCAVALHGIDPGHINDIDILVSQRDADMLALSLNTPNLSGDNHHKFRSNTLLRHTIQGIDIEFMAALRVHQGGKWHLIKPTTRCEIQMEKGSVYFPNSKEFSEILSVFGRKKDLQSRKKLRAVNRF